MCKIRNTGCNFNRPPFRNCSIDKFHLHTEPLYNCNITLYSLPTFSSLKKVFGRNRLEANKSAEIEKAAILKWSFEMRQYFSFIDSLYRYTDLHYMFLLSKLDKFGCDSSKTNRNVITEWITRCCPFLYGCSISPVFTYFHCGMPIKYLIFIMPNIFKGSFMF